MGRIPAIRDAILHKHRLQRCRQRLACCAAAALLISLAGIAGCAAWGTKPDTSLAADNTRQDGPIRPTTEGVPEDASEEATLAAIEEFLARTSAYQAPESTALPPTDISPQANRPSIDAQDIFARSGSRGFGHDDAPQSNNEVSGGDTRTGVADNPRSPRRGDDALANTTMSIEPGSSAPHSPISDFQTAERGPALPTLRSISVRTAAATSSAPESSLPVHATNVAIDVNDRPMTRSIDDWLDEWQSQSDDGRDFQAEWRLRLTQLALGRTDQAYDFAPRMSGETRSLLSTLFETVEAVRELAQNPLRTGDRALSRINALRNALADRSDLVIARVTLCRRVVTFGVYEEMDPTEFVSGRNIQTIVYSEIENFSARKQDETAQFQQGELSQNPASHTPYKTRLATRIEVFTAEGTSMWSKQEPEIVDRCRRRRTDFFLAQLVTLPPTLPAGEYVMKVYVEDKLSGKAAETTHAFTIHSPVSVARKP